MDQLALQKKIGKMVLQHYPDLAKEIMSKVIPQCEDPWYIPEIWQFITTTFTKLGKTDKNTLFVAVIYKMYAPSTFAGKGIGKLPAGIRPLASKLIDQKNPEMINYYFSFAIPNLKNPRYLKKVQTIIDGFLRNPDYLNSLN